MINTILRSLWLIKIKNLDGTKFKDAATIIVVKTG